MDKKLQEVVVVGGCGHVGLPFGLLLGSTGKFKVSLLDVDQKKVDLVNSKRQPFIEEGLEAVMQTTIGKTVTATTDKNCLKTADFVITVIGTPVDAYLNPTINILKDNVEEVIHYMKKNALLILRSTVYPGASKIIYELIKASNKAVNLAFCPERLAVGFAFEELKKFPQIISGFETVAINQARDFFLEFTPSVIELQPQEAELAKLFANTYRYLNFAISNQFYMLAQSCGLDFYKIYDALKLDYPRMKEFARAGFAAGPCLRKDTLQLAAFANNNFFLGHAAMLVNEGLPNFIVNELKDKLDLSKKNVAILGMAFKANCDDKRDSLSYKLKDLVKLYAKNTYVSDPYITDSEFVDTATAIKNSDIIIIGVPHSVYLDIDIPADKHIVDVWNFIKPKTVTKSPGNIDNTLALKI